MTDRQLIRPPSSRMTSILALGLLIVVTAISAANGSPLRASSSSTPTTTVLSSPAAPPIDVGRRAQRDALGEAEGVVPAGTTVFDDEIRGVAKLDPALLAALRKAATDARDDRVEFFVNSG